MQGEVEHFFNCPYCAEKISMLLESYYEHQSYIEDCEVCCKPIKIEYTSSDDEINSFQALTTDS